MDDETHSAIRRFQIHDGLAVTGELDGATAKALGVAPAAPGNPVAATTTLPVERGVSAGTPRDAERASAAPVPSSTPIDRMQIQPTPEPPVPRAEAPRAAPSLAPPRPQPSAARGASHRSLDSEANAFVDKYLVTGASPDVESEVSLYDERVEYFNNGLVNRDFIRRDTTNYRRRWPRRDYLLEGKPAIIKAGADGNSATLRFRIRYQVRAGLQTTAGHTESTMQIVRGEDGTFRIVSVKETSLPRS